jgi:hypothetical protein
MKELLPRFAAVMAILWMTSCGSERAAPATALRTPQNMKEFLLNVREAVASGLILREEFFTEDNLKRAFSASVVSITRTPGLDTGGSIHAAIGGFPAWIERDAGGRETVLLRISRYKGSLTQGKPKADVSVSYERDSGPRFEEVVQLFGPTWLKVERGPYVYPHGPPPSLPPVTHPQAYAVIKYQLGDASLDRTMVLEFDRHGRLSSLSADANASVGYVSSAGAAH